MLEFSDAFSLAGRISRFFRAIREFVAPARYPVNLFSYSQVVQLVSGHGLRLTSQFRYGLPGIPVMRFLSHEMRYKVVRSINGTARKNRNKWWGEEYICLLTLDPPRPS
jgi:hypothetical protein